MSTITVGNKTYSGNSVVIINGMVIIDGKNVTPDGKEINIIIQGGIKDLKVDACDKVSVTGNVNNLSTVSGNIDITGNVNGSIQTVSGKVNCGDVSGSIHTMSGDVREYKK